MSRVMERLATKTPEAAFLQVLEAEFRYPPRIAREILNLSKEMLMGSVAGTALRPGQVRVIVASKKASFGPPLSETEKVEVTLTMDAGPEDAQVKAAQGLEGLRRGRILRLTEEALEQGGVLTQEDLAQVLGVSRRTIVRDIKELKGEGNLVSTRGAVKNVGRGQTHKMKIIELWLDRENYGKISRWVHHSPQAIKRYVSTFLRIAVLHEQGSAVEEIAFLTQSSQRLVQDYLDLYRAAREVPYRREKLAEELQRVTGRGKKSAEAKKTRGKTA